MSFEVSIQQEAQRTRVAITGRASTGQLGSLLQVLLLESRDWLHPTVLLDVSALEGRFEPAQRKTLEAEAVRQFAPRRVEVRWCRSD